MRLKEVQGNMIPLSVPHFNGNEWKYVKECLDTEWVSSAGKYVDRFEEEICRFTGGKYAVACVNGTSALQISLKIAGVEAGNEVIVPTVTFIAPVNVIKYVNAEPIFMDCDAYYNIDVGKTIEFLKKETSFKNRYTYNRSTGRKISAVVPVHVFGNAVDIKELTEICGERNIRIIEDASESLGTFYEGEPFYQKHTGTIGQVGSLSFNGNKIITTGGGGMIVTNDSGYADRARYLTTQAKDDEIRYVHKEIGYNFRLTNIQAAMGVAQLEQLPKYLEIKRNNYNFYKSEIDKIPGLHLAELPSYSRNNHWMYALQIEKDIYGKDREALMSDLANRKIQTRPVWHLNHLQEPYKDCQHYKIEMAYEMLEKTLNIPCSVNLKEEEISRVIGALRNE